MFFAGVRVIRLALEGMAEAGLRRALRFLAGTPFRAVILGAAITGAIQSSSVTTALIVALAGARAVTLREAVGLVLGANIGATVTIQMLAHDVHRHGPAIIVVGLCAQALSLTRSMAWLRASANLRCAGRTMIGVGLLFTGIRTVAAAAAPLIEGEQFELIVSLFGGNPISGLIGGTLVSALVQSSSLTIATTIAACARGRLGLSGALAAAIGANVGTCITAIMAAAGSTVQAKRAATSHLVFNSLCAGLFMAFLDPFTWLVSRTSASVASQVANAHTIFNVVGAALALPLVDFVVAVVEKFVRD